jgi:hypothetical protein
MRSWRASSTAWARASASFVTVRLAMPVDGTSQPARRTAATAAAATTAARRSGRPPCAGDADGRSSAACVCIARTSASASCSA